MKYIITIVVCLLAVAFAHAEPIVTDSTSKSETTVKSPPPSAISPNITNINNLMCSSGVSAAIQTQILGISTGTTITDLNCEMVILSRELYSQQMKAPATTLLCQDARVWWSLWDSGVYCPVEGKFGINAKEYWEANANLIPKRPKVK